MKYWLHPEAEADLRDAAEFYRQRADLMLARAFLLEFRRTAKLLLRYPRLGSLWRNGRRRLVMNRFPFADLHDCRATDSNTSVAHQSRKPNYWGARE